MPFSLKPRWCGKSHPLIKVVCPECGKEYLYCEICHPDQLICYTCQPVSGQFLSKKESFYKSVKSTERIFVNSKKKLSKSRSKILYDRDCHLFPSGARLSKGSYERMKSRHILAYWKDPDLYRSKARDYYYSHRDEILQKQAARRALKGFMTKTRIKYIESHRDEINNNRRDYYSRNRDRILAQQRARRAIPEIADYRNQQQKLRRLQRSRLTTKPN